MQGAGLQTSLYNFARSAALSNIPSQDNRDTPARLAVHSRHLDLVCKAHTLSEFVTICRNLLEYVRICQDLKELHKIRKIASERKYVCEQLVSNCESM